MATAAAARPAKCSKTSARWRIPRQRRRCIQRPSGDFFATLAESGEMLPTWNGELYLELHRGTYTTQSRNKRANRKSEFLLHDAEFLAAWPACWTPAMPIPKPNAQRAWQLVCLNQFHDIIPGSSIGPVYVESQAQYAPAVADARWHSRHGAGDRGWHVAGGAGDESVQCFTAVGRR
jgi:hypothetical protein